MARGRGNPKRGSEPERGPPGAEGDDGAALGPIPELMRRVLSVGFSGFFMTETAIRKAFGDALPRDWVDFAVEQSQRTRGELLERLSFEVGRALENVDFGRVMTDLLEGRTLEIKAEIQLGERKPGEERGGTVRPRVEITRSDEEPRS